jgi:hypothetical protein
MEWKSRLALAIVAIAATASCSRNPRTAIIYGSSADPGVSNGTAFDRASIDMGECRWIVVPTKTEVEFSEKPGRLTLLMKKQMGFMGHPPNRTTIDEARQQMGCAYRKHDGKLFVGKFGEFDSGGEGGKFVSLTVRVPEGTVVERSDELELPSGDRARSSPLSLHQEGKDLWCSVEGSNDHWTPVLGEPDKETYAQH